MAKVMGLGAAAKGAIGIAIALLIWAILGVGVGLVQLYTVNTSAISDTAVVTVSRLAVAVVAAIAVLLKFFE